MNLKEKKIANILIDLYALFLESDRPEPHITPTLEEFIIFLTDNARAI